MPITNPQSNTRIDEIADQIYRISTPIPPNPELPTGFSFNQFLVVDDEPLLFHTGMRALFPLVRESLATVIPVERLAWIAYSHAEADESGALAGWLAAAPRARAVCSRISAMVGNADVVELPPERVPRALADGEVLPLGRHSVRWHDTPHLPHGWDAGLLTEITTRTLFCGDLFTQPGADHPPVTEHDILGPSETMRAGGMDYFANPAHAATQITQLAATEPALLACMHGAAYRGDGAAALRELARVLVRKAKD